MKSPEYVYGTVSVYRRLLDEKRNATPDEIRSLERLFCRSGFTDGYYVKKITPAMLGVRSDADKAQTRAAKTQFAPMPRPTRTTVASPRPLPNAEPFTLPRTTPKAPPQKQSARFFPPITAQR